MQRISQRVGEGLVVPQVMRQVEAQTQNGDHWMEALRGEGIDPARYAYGDWAPERRLPWDVIDPLVNKNWLALELRRALTAGTLAICGPTDCHGCAPFAKA